MINKNCSRCDKFTSVLESGRQFNDEFLCYDCLNKAIENKELEKPNHHFQHPLLSTLSLLNILYLTGSIIITIFSGSIINSSSIGATVQVSGPVGIAVIGAIFQSVFIYFIVKALILLIETVLKIYKKL